MFWWLAITAIIAAALAYGYWDNTNQSHHLTKIFVLFAEKYKGEVKKASLLTLPQLRFEMDRVEDNDTNERMNGLGVRPSC